jgi:hypothetical protein
MLWNAVVGYGWVSSATQCNKACATAWHAAVETRRLHPGDDESNRLATAFGPRLFGGRIGADQPSLENDRAYSCVSRASQAPSLNRHQSKIGSTNYVTLIWKVSGSAGATSSAELRPGGRRQFCRRPFSLFAGRRRSRTYASRGLTSSTSLNVSTPITLTTTPFVENTKSPYTTVRSSAVTLVVWLLRLITLQVCWTAFFVAFAFTALVALATPIALHVLYLRHMKKELSRTIRSSI